VTFWGAIGGVESGNTVMVVVAWSVAPCILSPGLRITIRQLNPLSMKNIVDISFFHDIFKS